MLKDNCTDFLSPKDVKGAVTAKDKCIECVCLTYALYQVKTTFPRMSGNDLKNCVKKVRDDLAFKGVAIPDSLEAKLVEYEQ